MFDENGIIGQNEGNNTFGGGDSCAWHGAYTMLGGDSRNFYDLFGVGFGGLRRHPFEGYSAYYKHPWDGRITRDQLSGGLAAMVAQKDRESVLKVWVHGLAWLGLFSYSTRKNGELSAWKWPDVLPPDIWSMFIRGMLGKYAVVLYPVLLLCDFFLILGAISILMKDDSHVISWLARCITANENTPTFLSKIALKLTPNSFLKDNLERYWCGWRDNCFMVDMYMERVKSLRK